MKNLKRTLTEQLPRLAGYKLAYQGLSRAPTPINLTLSITNACNSRCQSCDIWTIYPAEKASWPEAEGVQQHAFAVMRQ